MEKAATHQRKVAQILFDQMIENGLKQKVAHILEQQRRRQSPSPSLSLCPSTPDSLSDYHTPPSELLGSIHNPIIVDSDDKTPPTPTPPPQNPPSDNPNETDRFESEREVMSENTPFSLFTPVTYTCPRLAFPFLFPPLIPPFTSCPFILTPYDPSPHGLLI
jgi:hypothetical protein